MSKITLKELKRSIDTINRITGNSTDYENEAGEINVGHYHLYSTNKGYKMVQTCDKYGAVNSITGDYAKKSHFLQLLNVFFRDIETTRMNYSMLGGNKELQLKILIKNLIELSNSDDFIFPKDKLNTVKINGKNYLINMSEEK